MTGSLAPLAAVKSSAPLSRHCAAPLLSVCQTRDPRERSEPPFSELVASPSTDNNKKRTKAGFSQPTSSAKTFRRRREGTALKEQPEKGYISLLFRGFCRGRLKNSRLGSYSSTAPVSFAHFVIPKRSPEEWEEEKEGGYRAPERARGPGFFPPERATAESASG